MPLPLPVWVAVVEGVIVMEAVPDGVVGAEGETEAVAVLDCVEVSVAEGVPVCVEVTEPVTDAVRVAV